VQGCHSTARSRCIHWLFKPIVYLLEADLRPAQAKQSRKPMQCQTVSQPITDELAVNAGRTVTFLRNSP
jgi:hypothetical protein